MYGDFTYRLPGHVYEGDPITSSERVVLRLGLRSGVGSGHLHFWSSHSSLDWQRIGGSILLRKDILWNWCIKPGSCGSICCLIVLYSFHIKTIFISIQYLCCWVSVALETLRIPHSMCRSRAWEPWEYHTASVDLQHVASKNTWNQILCNKMSPSSGFLYQRCFINIDDNEESEVYIKCILSKYADIIWLINPFLLRSAIFYWCWDLDNWNFCKLCFSF